MKPLVLLVDDHEPHAEMLTLALESHGFAALSSTNGADAFTAHHDRHTTLEQAIDSWRGQK